jgi:hypothetical protein
MNGSEEKSLQDYLRRPKLGEVTVEVIKSVPDDDVEQFIIDGVESKLAEVNHDTARLLPLLPTGARALYLTWIVEAEVMNGGFNQLYWNGYGRYANDMVRAFEFFSAVKHAGLMREAIKVRAKERILMGALKLIGTIQAFSWSCRLSKLDPLDDRFYDITETLSSFRVPKIRSNPALFSLTRK